MVAKTCLMAQRRNEKGGEGLCPSCSPGYLEKEEAEAWVRQ